MPNNATKLTAHIYSRTALDDEVSASQLIGYLLSGSRYAPGYFGMHEPLQPLTNDTVQQAVALLSAQPAQTKRRQQPESTHALMFFERRDPPRCNYSVMWSKLPWSMFEISSYGVDEQHIQDDRQLSEWLRFTIGLVNLQDAWYSSWATHAERDANHRLLWRSLYPSGSSLLTEARAGVRMNAGIPGVYWGNYFGPFLVGWFGRDKLETVPCITKQWLDTGGVFFTTAPSPSDWNTPDTQGLQRAVKDHLGAEAFFDIEAVRRTVAALEPIPEGIPPEQFQPPRRLPVFPFKAAVPKKKSLEDSLEEARSYFEPRGFVFEGIKNGALVFSDLGGIMRVTEDAVEYWPKQR